MTIPQMTKETPPFVRFEYMESGRDAEASLKAGRPIPQIKPMVIVMQRGSKDEFVALAEEWLEEKNRQASEGVYPSPWVIQHRAQYEAFLKGDELPTEGTPIKTWAAITREQVIRILAFNLRTVEELAELPDASVMMLGLDGRHLRDLAKAFIAEGKGAAGTAKKVADLEEANRQKDEIIKSMQAKLAELEAAMPKRKSA